MSLPYYKRFPRDFLEGSIGMGLEVKGAFAIVLDLIYMRDGRLPDDARFIAGQLGCSVRKWTAIREELIARGKLQVHEGFISNFRADYLTEESRKYQDKQAEIAWKPRKNNEQRQPEPSQSEPEPEKKEEAKASLSPSGTAKPKSRVYPEDFEAAWRAYPHHKGRSSKPNAAAVFARLPPDERAGMVAAIGRFVPNVAETCGGKGAPDMAVWLKDGKHLNWTEAEPDALPVARFSGPAELRASVVAERDEDFALRFLDSCGWRAEDRTLLARNAFIAAALGRDLAAWMTRCKVKIEVQTANDSPRQTGEAA
jgi:uncharacterized protein YdaU (DUF1376 family)